MSQHQLPSTTAVTRTQPSLSQRSSTVSVVIATHNRPELLKQALASVLEQDYAGSIECIVVFDRCLPDTSLTSPNRHRQVRIIINSRTPGLAGARNSGILESSGEYVAFCDDDDTWTPDKLTAQVSALKMSRSLTAVSGIVVKYSDHETIRIPRSADLTLKQLVRRRVMEAHPSSVIVRRNALLGPIGLVDEDLPGSYGEDFDWILRAVQASDIVVVERALVHVRWGNSLFSQKWQTIIDAIDYGLTKHPVLSSDPVGLARLYGRRSFALAALGQRGDAIRMAWKAIRLSWRERRAYLTIAVCLRLISANRLMHWAHKRGHGI